MPICLSLHPMKYEPGRKLRPCSSGSSDDNVRRNVRDLTVSATAGCLGCRVLVSALGLVDYDETTQIVTEKKRTGLFICHVIQPDVEPFEVEIYQVQPWDWRAGGIYEAETYRPSELSFSRHTFQPTVWPRSLPFGNAVSNDTGSEQAIAEARYWLDCCLEYHSNDACKTTTKKLPTRMLRIDGPERISLHISTVRLLLTPA